MITPASLAQLKLEWEPAICKDPPTVAFNPCGHIVSDETAAHWSRLALPDNAPPNARYRPICPFCAKPLKTPSTSTSADGSTAAVSEKPFNKILFQQLAVGGGEGDDGDGRDGDTFRINGGGSVSDAEEGDDASHSSAKRDGSDDGPGAREARGAGGVAGGGSEGGGGGGGGVAAEAMGAGAGVGAAGTPRTRPGSSRSAASGAGADRELGDLGGGAAAAEEPHDRAC